MKLSSEQLVLPKDAIAWEAGLNARLLAVQTSLKPLTDSAIERLAGQLSQSVQDPFLIEGIMTRYFSLQAQDVETLLTLVRKNNGR